MENGQAGLRIAQSVWRFEVLAAVRTLQLALLMGGQACVFYGAAQVSRDIDLALLAEPANIERLRRALRALAAERIAVPPFDPALFERGHPIHFRCHAPGAEGLRIDLMSRLRLLGDFPVLWERRTTLGDEEGNEFNLLIVKCERNRL